ncbi:hypothetical protein KOI35_30740 [Actinoplanes bogorensis]|uniref:Uncharacterized protein n=1 Tax=Paractinoplanes bogorensis TaxID=1610840 RepID=A0ABS5YWT1_9ACTN|nr:hypothetical protein [Actinoplanes bogorensis]MBU2667897.1 hypothetical protein [Actinoplanes bogorensis]
MASDVSLERPVRPSDMRRHRGLHSRRGLFGAIADFLAAATNAFFV